MSKIDPDFCLIGLGNPGFKYRNTRHNVGFMIIDRLAKRYDAPAFELYGDMLNSMIRYKEQDVLLMKPVTFMNLSGLAVKELIEQTLLPLEKLIVAFDDLNLPFGTIRVRPSGSDGGQNGIGSIIYELQNDNFPRLRFGIGNTEEQNRKSDMGDFVLSEFTEEERSRLEELIETSCDAMLSFIDNGVSYTMNKFNKNYLPEPDENGEN